MSLKSWRERQGITQVQLAQRLGCSRETVSNNERRKLTNKFLGLFARQYPDDIREIIEGTGARDEQAQSGCDL